MDDFFTRVSKKKGKERKAFKKRILDATGAPNPTWYGWMRTETISPAYQKLIALNLNEPVETLFPEKD